MKTLIPLLLFPVLSYSQSFKPEIDSISNELEVAENTLDALQVTHDYLYDSLKIITDAFISNRIDELDNYCNSLRESLIKDSIDLFNRIHYPYVIPEYKRLENNNELRFKKEKALITRQVRIDKYNHKFYLSSYDSSKEGWFMDTDLVNAGLLDFVKTNKDHLNRLIDNLNVQIPSLITNIKSDSLGRIHQLRDSLYDYHPILINSQSRIDSIQNQVGEMLSFLEEIKDNLELLRLQKLYGKNNGNRIYNGEMWIGMTENMLYESWGKPIKVNKSVFRSFIKKQLIYRNHYIYVENGYVTSYQSSSY